MVRIRRKLESETLHLPELKPLIGSTVEITVEAQPLEVGDEFYAEAARLPDTEEAFEAQKTVFRNWRNDQRFEPYWPVLDNLLARTFQHVRKWAVATAALADLQDYDFDAYRRQREFDRQHAGDHLP
jgi:hypothetical protein